MTTKHDITIPQGGTWQLVIDVVDGPVGNLDAYTGEMQIRPTKPDPEVLAELFSEDFAFAGRQVVITVADEDTADMDWSGRAVYDIYIEGPAGDRWRILEGTALLSKTVTRED